MDTAKILVVDDDIVMLKVIEKQLADSGFRVVTAIGGREALQALEGFFPDLIITDILMPLTSGLELIGIVRSMHGNSTPPILVLSALDEEDTVLEAFNLGAEDFLTKPIKPGELSLRVKKLLRKTK